MVKSSKDQIMARVTQDLAEKGLEYISSVFLQRIHTAFKEVDAVDLWWIVGNETLVSKIHEISKTTADNITAIKSKVWEDRGFDYKSCQLAGHCGECADKKTCASVRQIEAKVRLKRRKEEKENDRVN